MAVTMPPAPRATGALRPRPGPDPGHGGALLLALVLASAYAAFAHGAVGLPEETRLQAGLALGALAAATAWIGGGGIRLRAPALTWAGIALLLAFAVWSAITLAWSVTPDRTWLEVNRALAYVLVLVLAVAAVSSAPRALQRIAAGYLVVAGAVALYALGGKVLPGVFHQADLVARLRAPLQYWNALALVCVLAVPMAIRFATGAARGAAGRLAALAALFLLLATIGMTYSRGGVLALVVAVVVLTALGGARLRGLGVLGAALLAVAPVLALAYTLAGLKGNGAAFDVRRDDGLILLGAIVVCLAALLFAGRRAIALEDRIAWPAERSRAVWRALGAGAVVLLLAGVVALAASDRGLGGSISDAADSFTEARQDKVLDPVRLTSTSSANRWVWWQEAAGAWSDKPVGGWGAGSFPVTHRLYRTNQLAVSQPHSVPLQFLAETGLVGALLALGSLALLFTAAVRGLRRRVGDEAERDIGVALLAAAAAWAVHGLYDWDWDIPGVTVPALLFLGALGAARRPGGQAVVADEDDDVFADPAARGRITTARLLALVGVTLLLSAYLVSVLLPGWSDGKTGAAQAAVSQSTSDAELEQAFAEADLASRLDPLAVRPLFAAAAIAQARDRLLLARIYLVDASKRQPDNVDVWYRLAGLALRLADRNGLRKAADRVLALDPSSIAARNLALRAQGLYAPVTSSATATGTPLAPAP